MHRSSIGVYTALVVSLLGTIVLGAPFSNEGDPAEVTSFYERFNNPDAHLSLTNAPDTVNKIYLIFLGQTK